jgi:phosphatidate cytidylyltransferase
VAALQSRLEMGSEMGAREAVAAVLIPVVVGIILFLPSWVLGAVLATVLMVAAHELTSMAATAGIRVLVIPTVIGVASVFTAAWFYGLVGFGISVLVLLWAFPTLQLTHPERPKGALSGMATNLFTVIYLGGGGACLAWLRLWPEADGGSRLLLLFLFSIWGGDSGAYYFGKNFGKHKMSPRVSPNKTWEGLLGGLLTTFAAAFLMDWILKIGLGPVNLLSIAAILGFTAPVGDLIESLFKRDTEVKDSSTLLPGHGGLLDRTDSLVYSAPPVLLYLVAAGYIA